MRLGEFILSHLEPILSEWEAFARTCAPASGGMDILALRDHAAGMLTAIAADLATPQGKFEQSEKSKGRGQADDPSATTAAQEHGAGRAESGFTVEQMVAEYRALRASVIRLWTRERKLGSADVEDLMRFNEAIDQALAESVTRYDHDVEQSKELFLAMLGHDLRTPLGAIFTSARFMADTGELEEPHRTLVERIAGSATRTTHMVDDLLDFTRSRLGGGIPVVRTHMNLGKVLRDVVEEVSASHAQAVIHVDTRGEQLGQWDPARLSQALANLIGNAVEHGAEGTAVAVEMRPEKNDVAIAIHNRGGVIPPDRMNGIFNPMKTREPARKPLARGMNEHLGLGLYIAERIVAGHGGHIDVASTEVDGTTFTVHLPRT